MAKIHGLLDEYVRQKHLAYKLNAPSPTERGETAVLSSLNAECLKIGKPFRMVVGTRGAPFSQVVGFNKIEGTPKADIAIVGWDGRVLKNIGWFSHKMGSAAKDFQQYSGTTEKADGKKPGSISKDKEVQKFLREIAQPGIYRKITKDKERFYLPIKNILLLNRSIFGPEFGSGRFGEDNVHFIGQGDAFLMGGPKGPGGIRIYTLKFSGGLHWNGQINSFMSGDYQGIIGARYTEGRNFTIDGKAYTDVRVLILPKVVLGGNAQDIAA